MEQKTTHVKQGLDRRLEQYRKDPDLQSIMTSLLARAQEFEDCLWEIINLRDIDSAVGVQLDVLGRIVGRGRGTLADAGYRIAVRCQIKINRSCGATKDLCAVASLSVPPGFAWAYGEGYPAGVVFALVDTWSGTDEELRVIWTNLQKTRSGGVRLFLEYNLDNENTFRWSPDLTSPVDSAQGWGDVDDPSIGGLWASVISE